MTSSTKWLINNKPAIAANKPAHHSASRASKKSRIASFLAAKNKMPRKRNVAPLFDKATPFIFPRALRELQ